VRADAKEPWQSKKTKRWQLHRGMPSLNVLDCGARLASLHPKTRLRLKQFGCPTLRRAKRHNVSAMIRRNHAPVQLRDILEKMNPLES